ncbi:hypothetical protein O7634_10780 [Micromonospora sp. WMMD1120]|uniref:hypothetical protein n=1 Tax=Micromonospora sp. WMMD1120 TaxID=3016106 RepID=UPI002416B0CC|nr:hypothetical protein [Micromonospora sp. WMMD1120]MDG4807231.1 hypothetical protein [Micromonospora sp. WMMD1120]
MPDRTPDDLPEKDAPTGQEDPTEQAGPTEQDDPVEETIRVEGIGDAGVSLPKFNLFATSPAFTALADVLRDRLRVELPGNLVPKPDTSGWLTTTTVFGDLRATLDRLFDQLRGYLPPNWPSGIDRHMVATIVQNEGLPLVWVPRREIVEELFAATDRNARIGVLLSHRGEVVEDCREVLADVSHPRLINQLPLIGRAVDASEDGHHEAAQALAVVVTETVVARAIPGKYKAVKDRVVFNPNGMTVGEVRLRAALAPIGMFYTAWFPSSGDPAPTKLSRHVTVHQADTNYYTAENAVVAVLLAASVIRAAQEIYEDGITV